MIKLKFNCPLETKNMTVLKNGFFCTLCNKTIVDYRKMTPTEIAKSISSNLKQKCGIFRTQQVINPHQSWLSSLFRMAIILVFFLGFSTSNLNAQDFLPIPHASIETIDTYHTIKGQITGENSIPLPFIQVSIKLKEQSLYAITDINGNYKIEIPNYTSDFFSIYAQSFGYDTTIVNQVIFKENCSAIEIDIQLISSNTLFLVGIRYSPSKLPRDPYELGKTVVNIENE